MRDNTNIRVQLLELVEQGAVPLLPIFAIKDWPVCAQTKVVSLSSDNHY